MRTIRIAPVSSRLKTDALHELVLDNDRHTDHHGHRHREFSASTIVEYARNHGVNLIVMGTHGRGAVAHLLLGSVAERVVRLAPCPVLTVRHPEHEFVQPDTLATVAHA